ncbi:Glutathione peroxidase [Grimontia indica]|uniref:Glutathione peroxidase n=1 Tax=Grimontia indica TaxID=1056512 RepID=R1IXF7_9GAMM|nr:MULTISPECIES: glutathione peroxidase [Grimontia]EOD79965.1 Glutathione peroxidase [Grimontia indica]
MKMLTTAVITLALSAPAIAKSCPDILNGSQRKLNSNETVDLCETFKGKTLLVVNTASQCGYTPQFEQLEVLYQKYKDEGFSVIGFPSNDFNQDRGNEERSAKVCYLDYGVTFPMMARSPVKGSNANPVFAEISKQAGVEPRWNFYKYLISAKGEVVATFPSSVTPVSPKLMALVESQISQR